MNGGRPEELLGRGEAAIYRIRYPSGNLLDIEGVFMTVAKAPNEADRQAFLKCGLSRWDITDP